MGHLQTPCEQNSPEAYQRDKRSSTKIHMVRERLEKSVSASVAGSKLPTIRVSLCETTCPASPQGGNRGRNRHWLRPTAPPVSGPASSQDEDALQDRRY